MLLSSLSYLVIDNIRGYILEVGVRILRVAIDTLANTLLES